MVGYLDPTSAAVGQVGVMAVNLALGGTYENLEPAIRYFKALQKNEPIVPKQTSYARVLSGEIPILFDYDFNTYRGQYTDKAPVQFVIPKEGTVVFPYIMALVANGPNPDNGKKVLDFLLSDESQQMWGNAYLRPIFAEKMSPEAKAKFLPAAEYTRAKAIDLKKLSAAQKSIVECYKEVN
jgi:putative spermidine/putrescine transport system substrate-binding protein